MPSPTILVTGGSGFIGRYVVERLRSDGIEPIVTASGAAVNNGSQPFDLTDEQAALALTASINPDIVLHLGGVTGAWTDAERCHRVNYVGTVNLLNALKGSGVTRIVLIGTAAEYGDQPTPFGEDMPLRPVSAYAVSKARANEYALDLHAKINMPVTILRVFTAYGFGQPHKMFLSQVIEHAVTSRRFAMSDGTQKRDLVFVGDVVDAILTAAVSEQAIGQVVNIASGRGINLRDLARKVWNICNADPSLLQIGAIPKSGDESFDTGADITRAHELLDWRPATPFIGDAAAGHPLYDMIDRIAEQLRSTSAASVRP